MSLMKINFFHQNNVQKNNQGISRRMNEMQNKIDEMIWNETEVKE